LGVASAWADAAPRGDVEASAVFLVGGPDGSLQALLPFRVGRVRFRRAWVQALTWAIGDTGCPDELDVPGVPKPTGGLSRRRSLTCRGRS